MGTKESFKKKLFKKAEVRQAKLKIGLYGRQGSGKTFTSLTFASRLGKKVSAIDTEYNMDIFATKFNFDIIKTRSLSTIIEILKSDEIKEYDVLIIDSLTHIWEDAQNSYIEALKKSKKFKERQRGEDEDLAFQDWKKVKRPYKKMIGLMLSLPLHVIFTTRESYVYEMKDTDQGKQLTVVGEKMDAERGTAYEPTMLFHMINENGKCKAVVEKDRTDTIQGKSFINPSFEILEAAMKKLGKKHTIDLPDESNSTDLYENEMNKDGDFPDVPATEPVYKDFSPDDQKRISSSIEAIVLKVADKKNMKFNDVWKQAFNGHKIDNLTKPQLQQIYKYVNSQI